MILAIDDNAIQSPATVAEAGDLVRHAAAAGLAIFPCGGRTQWDLGLAPNRPGIILDTRRLDQVIDYPARDMTITVQAGMTVARLQAILAGEKQRLPIDVPDAGQATVGGIVATNVSGPRRFGCGTLRDYLIGISVVNDEGDEVKAGGRVVKNVAGYDLGKLYIGSLGTLGVITQATFKLRPMPAEQGMLVLPGRADEMGIALQQLHATRTRPVCVELLNAAAVDTMAGQLPGGWPKSWSLLIGFEDNAAACQWQVGQLIQELGGRFQISAMLASCADPIWQKLIEFGAPSTLLPHGEAHGSHLSFKAGMPAAAVADFCLEADRLLGPVQLQAHAANGIVVGHCLGADVVAGVNKVRDLAIAAGGHLVVTRCPAPWREASFVWGPPRGDWALMRAIKDKLDPRGLFNPGRFIF